MYLGKCTELSWRATSKKDGGKKDWVWVPAGTCEKIVGGEAISKEPAKG
ncbi:DUF2282 domain-containing protein [Zhongshania sp.]|nr:DUF2282 domain-containing protein [Zhongshania sp.]